MNDEQKVAFLIGVLVGIVIAVLCSGPSTKEIVCCCGGSGSGPAPAASVDIDTRGNAGGSGGARSTVGCGCQDSGKPSAEPTPSVGRIGYPGRVIIKLKPTPKPR